MKGAAVVPWLQHRIDAILKETSHPMKARLQLASPRHTISEVLARVGQLPSAQLRDDGRDDGNDRYAGRLGTDNRRWSALLADATDDEILAVAVRPHSAA
jgi:hypothetical protein